MATPQLVSQDVFAFLTPDQINQVSNAAVTIECRPGEFVYARGQNASFMYVVLEGQVLMRYPTKDGLSIFIEKLERGALFGASVLFAPHSYMLSAQCLNHCKLLRIDAWVLRRMMDADPRLGYAIQRRVSELYFKRYIDVMAKMQAVVMSMPLEYR